MTEYMMELYNYHCPHCKIRLNNASNEVELIVERDDISWVKVFLSPTPYTYVYRSDPETKFQKNEEVDFLCPKCMASLVAKMYPKFVQIHLKVTSKVLIDIFFSRIHGVHKTYVGIEDFEETYGDEMANL